MHVLVIEDDPTIGKALEMGLTEAGHKCAWVKNGRRGLEQALSCHHDVIVLDLLLPEIRGLDVLVKLRAEGVRTPVLALTALGSVEERVAGLKAGADDYLVKPFAFPELLARLEAVQRRTADRPAVVIHSGNMTLDLTTHRVTREGQDLELTPTEFSILELLLRYAGQVVTRKMICEHVWGTTWEGHTNIVEVHIKRMRDKLIAAGDADLIRTIRGRGYAVRAL
jgi:two-component system OmpR family response regulator/two-component system copper resistance phosphate regulon response regulator CusR